MSRHGRHTGRALRLVAASVFVATMAAGPQAFAAGPTILGAGSTWSALAIEQWRTDVSKYGLSVNYQSVGSTQGRQFFASGTVDFGVTEIPFQSYDPPNNRKFAYLPIVAGGTSMMYNLKTRSGQQIRNLTLSPATIALIFTGQITNWNDKRITADYGSQLPDQPIRVIVRSDGSGTSYQFSAYLNATESSIWNAFTKKCGVASGPTEFWPTGPCIPNAVGQKGSDGIANYVSNPGLGVGSIGYLEAAYAVARNFPVVGVKNRSGSYVIPTAQNVARALTHAQLNSDSTQVLTGVYSAPEKNAYPISSYSYMIVPTDSSITTDKGAVLGKFINYFACAGQRSMARLGYSPMPKQLVQFAFAAEQKIPGAPAPPPIDAQHCDNPVITGEFDINSTGTLPGTDLTGGGGNTTGGGHHDPGGTDSPTPTDNATGPGSTDSPVATGPGGSPIPGGGVGSTVTVTETPDTLPHSSLKVLQRAAAEQIDGASSANLFPLVAIAILVLVVIFGPLLLRLRTQDGDDDA